MSQPDPTKEKEVHWTVASIALFVIGLLILLPSGLCTALGLTYVFSTLRDGDMSMAMMVVTIGGIPTVLGAALVYAGLKSRRRD